VFLGSIDSSLIKIYNCKEKDDDYSQNQTLYGKSWYINNPKRKDDATSVNAGIYINSNGYTSCRVLLGYDFSTLNLSVEAMKARPGVYRSTEEYPSNPVKATDPLKYYNSLNSGGDSKKEIQLKEKDGIYSLPVKINNTLTLDFVLDLGAADVNLSQDVFSVLVKAGAIKSSDYIGEQNYQLADGTIIKSNVINLKSLKIGEIEIKDVRASISNSADSPLLLGQSALKKLGKYSIDNTNSLLIIE
jgi:clan AA aspartic protease (TIGR02281 family)